MPGGARGALQPAVYVDGPQRLRRALRTADDGRLRGHGRCEALGRRWPGQEQRPVRGPVVQRRAQEPPRRQPLRSPVPRGGLRCGGDPRPAGLQQRPDHRLPPADGAVADADHHRGQRHPLQSDQKHQRRRHHSPPRPADVHLQPALRRPRPPVPLRHRSPRSSCPR